MKWIGQHIYDLISRFRNDVYLEDISTGTIASGGNLGLDSNNKIVKQADTGITDLHGAGVDGSANQLLTDDGDGTVTSESTLTYDAETLTIGVDDNGAAAIIRKPHSDEAGGDLTIVGGNSGGTDKVGGDLNLYSGAGTGAAYGGDINFYAGNRDVSTGSTNNLPILMATIDGSAGDFVMSGIDTISGKTNSDFMIASDGNLIFRIDADNDETSQEFSWLNYATEIMNLDESGNLQIDGGLTTGSTSFVNSSGVVQVATQGTIDHDSLANFVAAEHYDWSSDISGTATIHANNITDLHGAGVSGSANQLLTDDGDGTVTSESTLSYDSGILDIGADDDGSASIRRKAHSDEAGGEFQVRGGDAGGTDKAGGNLKIMAGRGTGSAAGGNVQIWAGGASGGGSSSSSVSNVQCATFKTDQSTILPGNLIFEGASPDANETTFSITDPTDDRTITVPDATGTMCISGASGSNMVVLGSGTGYVNAPAAQKWYFGNTLYGFNHFNWAGINVSMVSDSSTFTIVEDYNGIGQFVPAALSKVVARVSCRPATTSNETLRVTICSADRDAGGTNTTWTALASATNETTIGVWEACDATYTGSIATSKMLAIGVGIDEGSVSTGNVRFNWQLVGYLT